MGQAVFKKVQFVCCYFECKASHVEAGQERAGSGPPLLPTLAHLWLSQSFSIFLDIF